MYKLIKKITNGLKTLLKEVLKIASGNFLTNIISPYIATTILTNIIIDILCIDILLIFYTLIFY